MVPSLMVAQDRFGAIGNVLVDQDLVAVRLHPGHGREVARAAGLAACTSAPRIAPKIAPATMP